MDKYAEITNAAHFAQGGINGCPAPTAEQARSGNYRKGRVKLHGLNIAIETPQGRPRTGKTDGKPWNVVMKAHYGDLSGTKGADGDPVDVFIGYVPESELVWIVNRVNEDGSFDEHKVLLGFPDQDAAMSAYVNSYERGGAGVGSVISCSVEQLKWWLKYGNTTVALTPNQLPVEGNPVNEIEWNKDAEPVGQKIEQVVFGLRKMDTEGLLFDSVSMTDVYGDADTVLALDALVLPYNRLELKMNQLKRIMESAGGEVKPVGMQVSDPFKQRGTTQVAVIYELSDGQTVTAYFHNPDSTPNRLTPDDEMVSWKWLLNKKDVTIVVAPERGKDINPREVARRIMRLVEKNSARFQAANTKRAERMANIKALQDEIEDKNNLLSELDAEIEALEARVESGEVANLKSELSEFMSKDAIARLFNFKDFIESIAPSGYVVNESLTQDTGAVSVVADDGYGFTIQFDPKDGETGFGVNAKVFKNQIQQDGLSTYRNFYDERTADEIKATVKREFDEVIANIEHLRLRDTGEPIAIEGEHAEINEILKPHTKAIQIALETRHRNFGEVKSLVANALNYSTDFGIDAIGLSGGEANIAHAKGEKWEMIEAIIGASDTAKIRALVAVMKAERDERNESDYWKDRVFNKTESIVLNWSEGSSDENKSFANMDELQAWFLNTFPESQINPPSSGHDKNKLTIVLSNKDGEKFTINPRVDVSRTDGDFNPHTETIAEHLRSEAYNGKTKVRTVNGDEVYVEIPAGGSVVAEPDRADGKEIFSTEGLRAIKQNDGGWAIVDADNYQLGHVVAASDSEAIENWIEFLKANNGISGNPRKQYSNAYEYDSRIDDFAFQFAPLLSDIEIKAAKGGSLVGDVKDSAFKILGDISERMVSKALIKALDKHLEQSKSEGDIEMKGMSEVVLSDLYKKPAASSIKGWFRVNTSNGTRWTAGSLIDYANEEPAIRGWESRIDGIRNHDAPKIDGDAIKTPLGQSYQKLTPVAVGEAGKNQVVYMENEDGNIAALNIPLVQYFMSQYRDRATFFFHENRKNVGVQVSGEVVGVISTTQGRKNIKRIISDFKAGVRAPAEDEELSKEGADMPQEETTSVEANQSNPDVDYLNKIIAGGLDASDKAVGNELLRIGENLPADMSELFEKAVEIHSKAVVDKAKASL